MSLQSAGRGLRDDDPLEREIAELGPWFHNLHLPSGHQTAADHPLGDFPAFKWRQIAGVMPDDLNGARALDIGCNAGYYSFALAERGATVLAIDIDERYLRQARWAARWLDPRGRVTFLRAQIYELARIEQRFDLVLFMGVLYHLRYPLLALDLAATRVRGRMILQTLTMPGEPGGAEVAPDIDLSQRARLAAPGWPRAAFIEHALAGDRTNWWAPDDACVRAMVRSAGLRVVETPGHELYVCEPDPENDSAAALRQAELKAVLGAQAGVSQRK